MDCLLSYVTKQIQSDRILSDIIINLLINIYLYIFFPIRWFTIRCDRYNRADDYNWFIWNCINIIFTLKYVHVQYDTVFRNELPGFDGRFPDIWTGECIVHVHPTVFDFHRPCDRTAHENSRHQRRNQPAAAATATIWHHRSRYLLSTDTIKSLFVKEVDYIFSYYIMVYNNIILLYV